MRVQDSYVVEIHGYFKGVGSAIPGERGEKHITLRVHQGPPVMRR